MRQDRIMVVRSILWKQSEAHSQYGNLVTQIHRESLVVLEN